MVNWLAMNVMATKGTTIKILMGTDSMPQTNPANAEQTNPIMAAFQSPIMTETTTSNMFLIFHLLRISA